MLSQPYILLSNIFSDILGSVKLHDKKVHLNVEYQLGLMIYHICAILSFWTFQIDVLSTFFCIGSGNSRKDGIYEAVGRSFIKMIIIIK